MIVVRNVFRLKYGQARPALAVFKDAKDLMARMGVKTPSRVMTDLVGPSYTLVLENSYENLAAFETDGQRIMNNDEWRAWYQKFVPFVESGYREIYTVVE
jgi:NIPSNAP